VTVSISVVVALALDGLAGLSGGLLSERWLARQMVTLVSFAAGTLLAAVFLEILPEAVAHLGPRALPWAFCGFVLAGALERLFGEHEHDRPEATRRGLPLVLLASDALHNIGDGAAVAAAFMTSPQAGVIASIGVIAHEVPQEIGDFALLRSSGYSRPRALAALLCTQLSAGIGAAVVLTLGGPAPPLAGIILAVAGGSFLYVGTIDLAPELRSIVRSGARDRRAIAFAVGVIMVTALVLFW
jgi:zinc and cadmium transporter